MQCHKECRILVRNLRLTNISIPKVTKKSDFDFIYITLAERFKCNPDIEFK